MNIRSLIKYLEEIQEEHGNMPVYLNFEGKNATGIAMIGVANSLTEKEPVLVLSSLNRKEIQTSGIEMPDDEIEEDELSDSQ